MESHTHMPVYVSVMPLRLDVAIRLVHCRGSSGVIDRDSHHTVGDRHQHHTGRSHCDSEDDTVSTIKRRYRQNTTTTRQRIIYTLSIFLSCLLLFSSRVSSVSTPTAIWNFQAPVSTPSASSTNGEYQIRIGPGSDVNATVLDVFKYNTFSNVGIGFNLRSVSPGPSSGLMPGLILPSGSSGFTLTIHLRIHSTELRKNDTIWSIHTGIGRRYAMAVVFQGSSASSSTGAFRWSIYTASAGVESCAVNVLATDIGLNAFQYIAFRYSATGSGLMEVFRGGDLIGSKSCSQPLNTDHTYAAASIGGGDALLGTTACRITVATVAFYLAVVPNAELATLAGVTPPALINASIQVAFPMQLSSMVPVANLTIQPLALTKGDTVTIDIFSSGSAADPDGVVVSPSRVTFTDARAQVISVLWARMANIVSIRFRVTGGGLPTPDTICVGVRRPALIGPNGASTSGSAIAAQTITTIEFTNRIQTVPGNYEVTQLAYTNRYSAYFSGSQPYLDFSSLLPSIDVSRSGLTFHLALLFRADALSHAPSPDYMVLLHIVSSSSTRTGDELLLFLNDGRLTLRTYVASELTCQTDAPTTILPTNTPVFVSITLSPYRVDTASQTCALYLNGMSVSSHSSLSPGRYFSNLTASMTAYVGSAASAWVAAEMTAIGAFRGELISLHIFARALLEFELALLIRFYQVSILTVLDPLSLLSRALSSWTFPNAPSSIGWQSGPEGSKSGFVTSSGATGQSVNLAAPTDQTTAGQTTLTAFGGDTPFTLVMWVRVSQPPTGSVRSLFDCAATADGTDRVVLHVNDAGQLIWTVFDGSTQRPALTSPANTLQWNNWTHVALLQPTAASGGGLTAMFINGRLSVVAAVSYPPRGVVRNACHLLSNAARTSATVGDIAFFAVYPTTLTPYTIMGQIAQPPASIFSSAVAAIESTQQLYFSSCSADVNQRAIAVVPSAAYTTSAQGDVSKLTDLNDDTIWSPQGSAPLTYTATLTLVEASTIAQVRYVPYGGNEDSPAIEVWLTSATSASRYIATFFPPLGSKTPYLYTLPASTVKWTLATFIMRRPLLGLSLIVREISLFATACLSAASATRRVSLLVHHLFCPASTRLDEVSLVYGHAGSLVGPTGDARRCARTTVTDATHVVCEMALANDASTDTRIIQPVSFGAPIYFAMDQYPDATQQIPSSADLTSTTPFLAPSVVAFGSAHELAASSYSRWSFDSPPGIDSSLSSWSTSPTGAGGVAILDGRFNGFDMFDLASNAAMQTIMPVRFGAPCAWHGWILINSLAVDVSQDARLFGAVSNSTGEGLTLSIATGGRIKWQLTQSPYACTGMTSTAAPTNQWISYSIVLKLDMHVQVYIDATLYSDVACDFLFLPSDRSVSGLGSTTVVPTGGPWAKIGFVAFFLRALTASEVQLLATLPPTAAAPTAFAADDSLPTAFRITAGGAGHIAPFTIQPTKVFGAPITLFITPSIGAFVSPNVLAWSGDSVSSQSVSLVAIGGGMSYATYPRSVTLELALLSGDTLQPMCFMIFHDQAAELTRNVSLTSPAGIVDPNVASSTHFLSSDGILTFTSAAHYLDLSLASDTGSTSLMPHRIDLNMGFAVAIWISFTSFEPRGCILELTASTTLSAGIDSIILQTADNNLIFQITDSIGAIIFLATMPIADIGLSLSRWVHLWFQIDSSSLFTLFLDGTRVFQQGLTVRLDGSVYRPSRLLGSCLRQSGWQAAPNIRIAGFAYFDRAIQSGEIAAWAARVPNTITAAVAAAQPSTYAILSSGRVWRFSATPASGITTGQVDSGGVTFHPTSSSTPQFYNLLLPNEIGIRMPFFGGASRSYTIHMWHQPLNSFQDVRAIFSCGGGVGPTINGAAGTADFIQFTQDRSGTTHMQLVLDGVITGLLSFASQSQLSSWQFLLIAFDSSTSTFYGRVNGVTRAVSARNILLSAGAALSVCQLASGLSSLTAATPPIGYDGIITQVAYHEQVLTDAQIDLLSATPPTTVSTPTITFILQPASWVARQDNQVTLTASVTRWICTSSNVSLTYLTATGIQSAAVDVRVISSSEVRFTIPSSARLPISSSTVERPIPIQVWVDGFPYQLPIAQSILCFQPITNISAVSSGIAGEVRVSPSPPFTVGTFEYTLNIATFGNREIRIIFQTITTTAWTANVTLNGVTHTRLNSSYPILVLSNLPSGSTNRVELHSPSIDDYVFTIVTTASSISALSLIGLVGSTSLPLRWNSAFDPLRVAYSAEATLAFETIRFQITTLAQDSITIRTINLNTNVTQVTPTQPGSSGVIDVTVAPGPIRFTIESSLSTHYTVDVVIPRFFLFTILVLSYGPDQSPLSVPLAPTVDPATINYQISLTRAAPNINITYVTSADDNLQLTMTRASGVQEVIPSTFFVASIRLDSGVSTLTATVTGGQFTFLISNPSLPVSALTITATATGGTQPYALEMVPPWTDYHFNYYIDVPHTVIITHVRVELQLIAAIDVAIDTSAYRVSLSPVASAATTSLSIPIVAGAVNLLTLTSTRGEVYSIRIAISESSRQRVIVKMPTIRIPNPPSQIHADDILQLRSELSNLDPLITTLTYTWTSSDPLTPTLWSPSIVRGAINASTIILNPLVFYPGTYLFTLTVRDLDPAHISADGEPIIVTVSTEVTVTAEVKFDIQALENPCAKASPCMYGSQCVASISSTAVADPTLGPMWRMACTCISSPVLFVGPTCSFAIVRCADCLSSSTFFGNKSISMLGIGFASLLSLTIASREVPFDIPKRVNASEMGEVATALATLRAAAPTAFATIDSLEVLSFRTPALVNRTIEESTQNATDEFDSLAYHRSIPLTGLTLTRDRRIRSVGHFSSALSTSNTIDSYQPLVVSTFLPGTSEVFQLTFTNLIFYSSSACNEPGQWKADGAGGCLTCPSPGGGRVWPESGYWSLSEFVAPVRCPVSEACLGVDAAAVTQAAATAVNTQNCATGYQDTRCSQCAPSYYTLNARCYYCGSSNDQRNEILVIGLVALSLMLLLAGVIGFLPAVPLAKFAKFFRFLQEIALIGLSGSKDVPFATHELSTFFTYLNFINFELEILRPGCAGVPTFNFIYKFSITIGFMIFTGMLFIGACAMRLAYRIRKERRTRREGRMTTTEKFKAQQAVFAMQLKQKYSMAARKDANPIDRPPPPPFTSEELYDEFPPWVEFRQRLLHALLILLSIFYLRMVILSLKAFKCVSVIDSDSGSTSDAIATYSLVLAEDMQTRCYEGDHLIATIVIAILLIAYIVGFPIACLVVLSRSFGSERTGGLLGWLWRHFAIFRGPEHKILRNRTNWHVHDTFIADGAGNKKINADSASASAWDDTDIPPTPERQAQIERQYRARMATFGYLFIGYRPDYFAQCILIYLVHIWFATVQVFSDEDGILSLFLYGLAISVETFIVAAELPHILFRDNVRRVVVNLVTMAHSIAMLAMQSSGTRSRYFYGLLSLFAVCSIFLTIRQRLAAAARAAIRAIRSTPTEPAASIEVAKARFRASIQAKKLHVKRQSIVALPAFPMPTAHAPRDASMCQPIAVTIGGPTVTVTVTATAAGEFTNCQSPPHTPTTPYPDRTPSAASDRDRDTDPLVRHGQLHMRGASLIQPATARGTHRSHSHDASDINGDPRRSHTPDVHVLYDTATPTRNLPVRPSLVIPAMPPLTPIHLRISHTQPTPPTPTDISQPHAVTHAGDGRDRPTPSELQFELARSVAQLRLPPIKLAKKSKSPLPVLGDSSLVLPSIHGSSAASLPGDLDSFAAPLSSAVSSSVTPPSVDCDPRADASVANFPCARQVKWKKKGDKRMKKVGVTHHHHHAHTYGQTPTNNHTYQPIHTVDGSESESAMVDRIPPRVLDVDGAPSIGLPLHPSSERTAAAPAADAESRSRAIMMPSPHSASGSGSASPL